jgi:hypothetical protein
MSFFDEATLPSPKIKHKGMNKKRKGNQPRTKLTAILGLCCIALAVAYSTKAQSPGTVKLSIRFPAAKLDLAMQQLKEACPVNIAYDAGKLNLQQWSIICY